MEGIAGVRESTVVLGAWVLVGVDTTILPWREALALYLVGHITHTRSSDAAPPFSSQIRSPRVSLRNFHTRIPHPSSPRARRAARHVAPNSVAPMATHPAFTLGGSLAPARQLTVLEY